MDLRAALITILLALAPYGAAAETVCVKYREPSCISVDSFDCTAVTRSSFIGGVCYRPDLRYMLILLRDTWYHYCEIDAGTVAGLLAAPSMGKFFNSEIRETKNNRRFDCDGKAVPEL
jgi:hypothetical protein